MSVATVTNIRYDPLDPIGSVRSPVPFDPMGHLRPPHRDPTGVQLGTLGWDPPDVPLVPLEPHVYTFDAPKSDSIQNSIENKIWNIQSIESRIFNRITHSKKLGK